MTFNDNNSRKASSDDTARHEPAHSDFGDYLPSINAGSFVWPSSDDNDGIRTEK
jgi:hypothetical protein